MFKFFAENNLISHNQSGFKSGDWFTNQFLSITHQIHKSFDNGQEVWSLHLDTFKAFQKLCCKGLIFKLKQNIISSLSDFLKFSRPKVILNDQLSLWINIEVGVPQESILGLFIYIDDLTDELAKNARLSAHKISLFL